MTSNASPYAFVSLEERLKYVVSSTMRQGKRVELTGWRFLYVNAERQRESMCFGIDELDAYQYALRLIAKMEKQYFKRQEAKHVAAVQG
jgi:hypothetical protein